MSQSHPDDDDPSEEGFQAEVSSEEARLVAAAQAGDSAAFTALVKMTHADVYTLAYKLVGNEDDARDVAQEAYLRAFRSLKRFRGDAKFSTWMFRITANCASTHLTIKRKHRHEEPAPDKEPVDERLGANPSELVEAVSQHERLIAILGTLTAQQRAVIVLHDVYRLTHKEIAKELRISENNSKQCLFKARDKIHSRLFPGEARGEGKRQANETLAVEEGHIQQLPESLQPIARLWFLRKMNRKQLQEELEIPRGTVDSRLTRATVQLRKLLSKATEETTDQSEG